MLKALILTAATTVKHTQFYSAITSSLHRQSKSCVPLLWRHR